jgi:hypothetical protein
MIETAETNGDRLLPPERRIMTAETPEISSKYISRSDRRRNSAAGGRKIS